MRNTWLHVGLFYFIVHWLCLRFVFICVHPNAYSDPSLLMTDPYPDSHKNLKKIKKLSSNFFPSTKKTSENFLSALNIVLSMSCFLNSNLDGRIRIYYVKHGFRQYCGSVSFCDMDPDFSF
jgi:hypothetical protein